jgi:uncharacterized protein YbaA (DUF1428 family)
MPYVDGYILPVPTRKLDEYKKIARKAGKVWMDHGALEYRECVADDLQTAIGTPFRDMVQTKRGETIIFAWVFYRSKAHRDRVNAKVMSDPRLKDMGPDMVPFDVSRMAYAGFTTVVNLTAD